jgi:alcohol dehydrogenase
VTAATGIDALSHAVESFVCTRRNPVSQLFGRQAWQLLCGGFPTVLRRADDLEARSRMLLGAHLAGSAIESSMLGAAHALANPLSAHFDVRHGVAIGVMLPVVVHFNAPAAGRLYGELAHDIGLCEADDPRAAELLASRLTELTAQAGLPTRLEACGVDRALIPTMAGEAAQQWTGKFNPQPLDEAALRGLYERAM